MTYNFTTGGVPQRLANLGFTVVVQLGNRGGSPERSNAYQSFSYFNMRDYGLADKKAGIEQLAARGTSGSTSIGSESTGIPVAAS